MTKQQWTVDRGHPSEQRSLAGDPGDLGHPKIICEKPKQAIAEESGRWSTAFLDSKIEQAGAAYYGNDAQNRRNREGVVFCFVDLNCANIHFFLLARIRESPVDKRCNPDNDQ